DLCCGEGNALIEAAGRLGVGEDAVGGGAVSIVGVDLVGRLRPGPNWPGLSLVTASLATWNPAAEQRFDLVTCVHGLHYIGDKLGLLTRAARWLSPPDGVLIADFDPSAVRHPDGSPATRRVIRALRQAGAGYDPRTHRLTCRGPLDLSFAADYLGADDAAGPSYTGQPGVASHYRWL
ncbi:class I SAM-dependent methyltransferase, partial [Actinospica durhamensis]